MQIKNYKFIITSIRKQNPNSLLFHLPKNLLFYLLKNHFIREYLDLLYKTTRVTTQQNTRQREYNTTQQK